MNGLTFALYFDYSRRMKHLTAVDMLSALAHDTRLRVFKLLVRQGPEGLSAGKIAQKLDTPQSTLSFHLSHLTKVDLVKANRQSRSIIYSVEFNNIENLLGYLTENCCKGDL